MPPDLQKIVDEDGAKESVAIAPQALQIFATMRKGWTDGGGELISLPPDEQASMMAIMLCASSVGDVNVSKTKPDVRCGAYEIVTAAAKRFASVAH